MIISMAIASWINYYVYLAVFCKLQVTSVYEYLEMRYNIYIKNIVTCISLVNSIICLPLFIYAPCLTFSQVSGIDVHIIAPIMILLCLFYTSFGGVKAVIWTDTLQFAFTLITLLVIIIIGIVQIGGINVLFDRAKEGNRLEFFNFDFNPTVRCTFWTTLIGYTFTWTGLTSIAAPEVQRFLAIPQIAVTKVLVIFTIVISSTKIILFLLGLTIYGTYYDCDPKSNGEIKKADQIVPYYIMELTSNLPGFNGLFVAAFFGAAFSTLSTLMNTLAGIIYSDFAQWFLPKKFLKLNPGVTMKLFTILIGLSCIGLLYVLEKVGTLFEVIFYLKGVTGGAVLGIFTLGMIFPTANTKGAASGAIISIALMSFIIVKNQMYIWNGTIKHEPRSLQTYGCNATHNVTIWSTTLKPTITPILKEEPFWLFKLSFQYYYVVGTLTTILVGLLMSWMTRRKGDPEVNPDYISPLINKLKSKLKRTNNNLLKDTEPLKSQETNIE